MIRDAAEPTVEIPFWRRILPFGVGGALVAWVATRLDFRTFARAVQRTNYFEFALFAFGFTATLLAADVLATTYVYRRTIAPVRYRELFVIRAASYLPSILNHHVGQAWLTYFLSKVYRVPLARAAGSTLLVYATTFGALFLFLVASILLNHSRLPWLVPTVAIIGAAGICYALVLAIRPRAIANIAVAGPLFDAGLSGHLAALVVRLPHMAIQFIGAWVPFLFFGIQIPFSDALALIPVIMLVVTLPVSPQGLGTRDALSLALLSGYAPGTPAERASTIAAATLSWLVVITIVQLSLSPLFMKRAYELLGGAIRERVAS
jgi:hypothetical protein